MRVSFPIIALSLFAGCATLAEMARGAVQRAPAPVAGKPDLFGSVALKLGHNRYSDRWHRVALGGGAAELGPLVAPARTFPPESQAAFVNAALNGRIRYRFDSDPSGDRWATARETLEGGAGDCEDYAIAKMHALRRLGARPGDLFMTIGHGSARARRMRCWSFAPGATCTCSTTAPTG
jgi:predicted transglutaminase-like cysteine proteinase